WARLQLALGSTEEIARGEVAGAQGFVKQLRLRAFCRPPEDQAGLSGKARYEATPWARTGKNLHP
ncbi:MAG TPA: hypothetical protein VN203_15770, partial [Candidatus Acidoferrum sp.]|nr:hypothetical protein [Candidatus Acidoferrum sp.]